MSTATSTPAATSAAGLAGAPIPPLLPAYPELYRFTVDQYERMGDAGILTEDDRVELVEGLVYRKPMKKGPHAIAGRETAAALTRQVPAQAYFVTREDPVSIPGRSGMPEPDVSVVRGQSRDYLEQPKASDVPLLAEVSGATLAFDQGEKLLSYARGGIPVYWIVNLVDRRVEVYTGPGPDGYPHRQDYHPGDLVPIVLDGQEVGRVAVDELLP